SEHNPWAALCGGDPVRRRLSCIPASASASASSTASRLSPVAVVWAAPMEDPPDVYRSAPHGGADLDDPLGLGSHP
ncbi:MAG: hypothetical protein ACJ8AX_02795, partial [Gemmatimonadales bacterium]